MQTISPFKSIGHFSHAVKTGNTLYLSGQLGINTETSKLVDDKDAVKQADQAMKNIKTILEASGSNLHQIVKVTILLSDIADYGPVTALYARHLGDHKPARSCYAVHQLPLGAKVEIECIAYVDPDMVHSSKL